MARKYWAAMAGKKVIATVQAVEFWSEGRGSVGDEFDGRNAIENPLRQMDSVGYGDWLAWGMAVKLVRRPAGLVL